MDKQVMHDGQTAGPGVWRAPWTGPRGEPILVAVAPPSVRLCERMVAPDDDWNDVVDELWWLIHRHGVGLRVL
jgi:hypothetical protein